MAKVLLVEDDNSLREIFEMRLQADGYQTVTAGDGEEGLTVAMKEKPDLIIADVMMPKLSGFEMVENLKAAPEMKDVKVIMMTALGQAEDRERGERLGVVKYLVKSQATLEDFANVVREVLSPDKASASPKDNSKDASQNNNQPERKEVMQEDTTPTNPMGGDQPAAPADNSMPPATNPVMGGDSGMGASDSGQQSTAEEQSTVNDQVNSFAGQDSSAAPAADAGTSAAPADPGSSVTPSAPAMDTDAPAMPPATDAPAGPAAPAPGGDQTPPTDPNAGTI